MSEFIFRKAVTVLQIFRHVNVYTKSERSFALRKQKIHWPKQLSKSGFIENGILCLPESIMQAPQLHTCDLITIEDHFLSGEMKQEIQTSNRCLSLHQPVNLYIFQLNKKEALELFLRYDRWEVGFPERTDFKLGTIKTHQPLAVKINGKNDFSASGRRERTFTEQYFVLENLGSFDKCTLLKKPQQAVEKKIPEPAKLVNLIKPLW